MQDTLQFSDYVAMLDILQNNDVRAIFNDDQLKDAFDNNQLHQVQEQIHQSDAVKSFLCNGPLIKRIAEMQLKIKTHTNAYKQKDNKDEDDKDEDDKDE